MINNPRETMDATLREVVVPVLRAKGFRGTLPHFRRPVQGAIDLLTFQFDKWGGGFVVEIARCSDRGFTTHWGKHIPPRKGQRLGSPPGQRQRIQPRAGSGTDSWFRFDNGQIKRAAQEVLDALPEAESWWARQAQPGGAEDAP